MSLIHGETVTVIRYVNELDDLGELANSSVEYETVENVVVAPGATKDMEASRPSGVTVALTLCFPKTYTQSLRGCSVEVLGEVYSVIGNPVPCTEANTPGDWNYTVEVTRNDG